MDIRLVLQTIRIGTVQGGSVSIGQTNLTRKIRGTRRRPKPTGKSKISY